MVSVLYTQTKSIYDQLQVDTYNRERDAKSYRGTGSIICHPPCRKWSKIHGLSKGPIEEKNLAIHALIMVRLYGGILEHPKGSKLWREWNIIQPGYIDEYGGWTLNIDQFWWGHKCKKNTTLYIVGIHPREIPTIPYKLDAITHNIGGKKPGLKQMGKKENEATPIEFAKWLIKIATIIETKKKLLI